MFNIGIENPSKRMEPGIIRELFIAKYPTALDIPAESEIRSAIISLLLSCKKSTSESSKGRNSVISEYIVQHLTEIIIEQPNMKPSTAVEELKKRCGNACNTFPTYNQIKVKFSKLKSKIKAKKACVKDLT
jgi:hypothetical protein